GSLGTVPLLTQADGLRLLPAGRATDLPWLGANQIILTVTGLVGLAPSQVKVNGINVVDYGPVRITPQSTSPPRYVLTLARPMDVPDRVTIRIDSLAFASYTRRLDVLPGDVNDDGVVNSQDAVIVRNQVYGLGTVTIPLGFLDIDGDGNVFGIDFNL